MAEKLIHICDICESFAEPVHELRFIVVDNRSGGYFKVGAMTLDGGAERRRQICTDCINQLIVDLKLSKTKTELNREMFEGINPSSLTLKKPQ